MRNQPAPSLDQRPTKLRGRIIKIYALLLLINLAVWGWALLALHGQPMLLGTALLVYGLGMRRALDAVRIAALGNVTRKLIPEGKHPVSLGFFLALGHTAVVVLATLAIVAMPAMVPSPFDAWRGSGAIVAELSAILFLFAIAAVNAVLLRGVMRARRAAPAGGAAAANRVEGVAERKLARLMTRSWHMVPLGMLFGLGVGATTEAALFGICATEAAQGMALWSVMVFPALFAAGLSLIDTTDGVLLLGAYNWAFIRPRRRLRYNIVVTAGSVAIAVLVGGLQALGLVRAQLGMTGWIWDDNGMLAGNAILGIAMMAVFMLVWVGWMIAQRPARQDEPDGAAARG